ncbi:hypothetical protein [Luteimonas sp. SDU101]|uniref:hypothetical protein n=1 Tax=Luteimonas sp. SDU101 TaxID=3422593 RepID=UPI003EC0B6A1
MNGRREEQQELLAKLRTTNELALETHASNLDELYRARQMAGVTSDGYMAAKGEGVSPHGWLRGSENPALLLKALPGSDLSEAELLGLLKPDTSGFRAEIYFPDPEILGPGFKPTLVFKGSAGEVLQSDGTRRDTALEDFAGNNFPQSVGLPVEYHDRGMDLAVFLRQQGLEFDMSGHSMGAAVAAAASAVTGMRAYTFNPAGLHPETVDRFAKAHNVPVYDTLQTVTAWQVQGDLLNDGVQGDLAKLGVLDRYRLGSLLSDTAGVLRNVPEARQALERELMAGISESSHPAVHAFLDRLESGNGASLLRDLPQAAGVRKPPLPAMASVDGVLVDRQHAASVADLHRLASPLLTTLASAARGAETGSSVGQVVAAGGRWGGRGLDLGGDSVRGALGQAGTFAAEGYRAGGTTFAHGTRSAGELAAQWRELGASVEAGVHDTRGWVQERQGQAAAGGWRVLAAVAGVVSPQARRDLERQADASLAQAGTLAAQARAEAGQARAQGQVSADAIRLASRSMGEAMDANAREAGETMRLRLAVAGTVVDAVLDAGGQRVEAVAARAPLAGAALGGTQGMLLGGAVAYRPGSPWTGYDVHGTVELARQAGPALHEALQRHGMDSAMIPSLDGEIARQEEAARALLRMRGRDAPPVDRPLLHTGESGRALDSLLDAIKSGDGARISAASAAMLDTPQARHWLRDGEARLDGLQSPAVAPGREASPPEEAALAR